VCPCKNLYYYSQLFNSLGKSILNSGTPNNYCEAQLLFASNLAAREVLCFAKPIEAPSSTPN